MKFEDDVGFGLDGFAIEQGGLVAPLADGSGDIGEKGHRATDGFQSFDAPVFVDDSAHRDAGAWTNREVRRLGIDSREQFANRDLPASSGPQLIDGGHKDRTLNAHSKRGQLKHALAWEVQETSVRLGGEIKHAVLGCVHADDGGLRGAGNAGSWSWRRRDWNRKIGIYCRWSIWEEIGWRSGRLEGFQMDGSASPMFGSGVPIEVGAPGIV